MKSMINMGLSLAFLATAGWIVKDVLLVAEPNPIGGSSNVNVEAHQGELDTFRQAN
ncbi:MAG: hypothetical protein F6K30_16710 [Cyanothece sp. SIO2G6]|nr:hypothetical protein [Cyanothece sp. SIO2G6]